MEQEIRSERKNCILEPGQVADIADPMVDPVFQAGQRKQGGGRRNILGVPTHLRTTPQQPQSQPASFEARVSSYHHPGATENVTKHPWRRRLTFWLIEHVR